MRRLTVLVVSLLLVGVLAIGAVQLMAKPGGGGKKGWTACPFPPCMAPCAFPPEPEVLCRTRGGGEPFVTSWACCCCGGGGKGTFYRPLS